VKGQIMDREELLKLHAALGAVLALPESIRELLAKWLETAKPNDKARRRKSTFSAKTAERKLLEAMRDNPNLSVIALANAAGSSRSVTGERLRQLAVRDLVEKDATGRWKLKREEPGPTPSRESEPDPPQPSPN
jgi:hypothetical protein